MNPILFLPSAREDLLAAATYYEKTASGLGLDFLAAVEWAVARITAFPEHGSPHLKGTRRVVLRRFPLSVVYLLEPETILIVAIAHHSRKPGYWQDRF